MTYFFVQGNLHAQQTETWSTKSSMPEGRHHPVTWNFGDTGYVVTGSNANDIPTDDFYSYDPATDTWTTKTDFPGPVRSFAIGEEYNGKGYLGFGANSFYLNDLWEYDPATDSWTQLASCPCSGRRHPAMVIQDGRLFVGLGDDNTGNLDDWWEYDIATNTWTEREDLPGAPRHHPFQFKAGDGVYVGLGHGSRRPFIYKDWYRYDLDSNKWEKMNDFPGESRVAGTQFDRNGLGYVLSGDGSDHSWMQEGEFWEYDPAVDTWTELTPHPGISKWAPGSFLLGDTLYFLAGQNRDQGVNTDDNMAYTFATPTVSIREQKSQNQAVLRLYPNPAHHQFQISHSQPLETLRIYNLQGALLRRYDVKSNAVSIGTEGLTQGIYIVEAEQTDGVRKRKRLQIRP